MQEKKFELLLRQTGTSARFAMGAAGVSLAVLGWYHFTPWLLAWALSIVAVSLFRYSQHSKYPGRPPEARRARRVLTGYKLSGALSGALWGALAAYPANHLPPAMQSFTLLCPAMVATGAISSYASHLDHYRAFLFSLVGALLFAYTWTLGNDALPAYPVFLLFGLMLDTIARHHNRALNEVISAHQQVEAARQELEAANQQLTRQHKTIQKEEDIARHVFAQLTLGSDQDTPGIHTWNQAMGSLSGDLIQVARCPRGDTFLFLGDFTGHGLPAALGALPASSVFRTMVRKGLDVPVIARELNTKLHTLLPTGYFCCAVLMRLSRDRRHLTLWNGGLPPVLIKHRNGEALKQIRADNLPLGVVGDAEFSARCSHWELAPGDHILAYSDGLTEAENLDGRMWGRERLTELLCQAEPGHAIIEQLKEELLEFTNLAPPSDDISVIEILAGDAGQRQAVA